MEFITAAEMEQIGQEVLEKFIIPSYDKSGHNASGELRRSLRVVVQENKTTFYGSDYAQFLILGRRPNKDQSDEAVRNWVKWFAPNVFQPWMDSKGLSMNAYLLANLIARKGTKKHRRGSRDNFMDVLKSSELLDYVRGRIGFFVKASIVSDVRERLLALRAENDKQ